MRLYALRAAMPETNTFERLRRLGQLGVLSPSLYSEVALAYELPMSLRLRHQGEAVRAGLPLGNQIGNKRSSAAVDARVLDSPSWSPT